MGGKTYTQREDFFFPYLLPGARGCQLLHPLASSSETTSVRLRVPRSTAILCTMSKSERVVLITWSSSGYTPVRPECPDAPSFSCLLIKMWQLTKAHRVARNEPKIHVICYITEVIAWLFTQALRLSEWIDFLHARIISIYSSVTSVYSRAWFRLFSYNSLEMDG